MAQVQAPQLSAAFQTFDLLDAIEIEPQHLQVRQPLESVNVHQLIAREVDVDQPRQQAKRHRHHLQWRSAGRGTKRVANRERGGGGVLGQLGQEVGNVISRPAVSLDSFDGGLALGIRHGGGRYQTIRLQRCGYSRGHAALRRPLARHLRGMI